MRQQRICDNGRFQRIAPISARPYYSVDSPEDVELRWDLRSPTIPCGKALTGLARTGTSFGSKTAVFFYPQLSLSSSRNGASGWRCPPTIRQGSWSGKPIRGRERFWANRERPPDRSRIRGLQRIRPFQPAWFSRPTGCIDGSRRGYLRDWRFLCFRLGCRRKRTFLERACRLRNERVFNLAASLNVDGYEKLFPYAESLGAKFGNVVLSLNMIDDVRRYAVEEVETRPSPVVPPIRNGLDISLTTVKNFLLRGRRSIF